MLSLRLNNTINVNLILDTGCQNIVLFGKKFQAAVNGFTGRTIRFAGLGDRQPLTGKISIDNEVRFNGVRGHRLVVIVVPKRAFVSGLPHIDGVIGYDLLRWFEIEINPKESSATFRDPEDKCVPADFLKLNLREAEILPTLSGQVITSSVKGDVLPLLLDTGSQLGLLLKSRQANTGDGEVFARGLCGNIKGVEAYAEQFQINQMEFASQFLFSVTATNATERFSIGMDFLKDYVVIINSVQRYVAFKSIVPKKSKRKSMPAQW